MYDPSAPSSLLAIAEYRKPEIARQLIRYARWRSGDDDEAKDLLADVLMRVCDPDDKPWDPHARTFFRHMRHVMDDHAIKLSRAGPGRFEVSRLQGKGDENDDDVFERVVALVPGPDAQLNAGRRLAWLREMMDLLVARIGPRDPLSMRIWRLVCENRHDEPEEYAEALGVHVTEIYEALRRLRYHGAKIRAEWEAREKQRLARLREPFDRARKKAES